MTPSQLLILDDLRDFDPDGLLGGYSIAFDLVSREYGWTDDQIMDLPIRTLRQKIAAINRRKYFERRDQISMMSWQTRQITTFVAAGYMVDGHNGAVDQAQMLAYDKIEEAQLAEATQRGQASSNAPFDPENPPEIPVQPGTFERFMGSMGSPGRWAGR